MSDSFKPQENDPKRSTGRRWWLIIPGTLVGLLIIGYFVITSSGFLKSVILPRIGEAIGAEVHAGAIYLSPWSQVEVQNLEVRTTGAEPLAKLGQLKVRYHLRDLIHGNFAVQELRVSGVSFVVEQNADGTSNLDPLVKKVTVGTTTPTPAQPAAPPKGSPLQVALQDIHLSQAAFKYVKNQKDGSRTTLSVEGLNLNIDQVRNAQPGKLDLNATVQWNVVPSPRGVQTNAQSMTVNISANFAYELNAVLQPSSGRGSLQAGLRQAVGPLASWSNLDATLECDLTPTEVRQTALTIRKSGQELGRLRFGGPLRLAAGEADLKAEVSGINQQLLNLIGAARGWDFGTATLGAAATLRLTDGGKVLNSTGQLKLDHFSVHQTNLTTPVLDLSGAYQVDVNLTNQSARLERLELLARQNNQDLLQTRLDQAMVLSWSSNAASVPDSALRVTLTNFNLSDWQALLGPSIRSGRADAVVQLKTAQGGHQLDFSLSTGLQNASVAYGSNRLEQASARFQAAGQCQNLQIVQLRSMQFAFAEGSQELASGQGSLSYDQKSGDFQSRLELAASLARWLEKYPVSGVKIVRGTAKYRGEVGQKEGKLTAAGHLAVTDFTGSASANLSWQDQQLGCDFSLEKVQDNVRLTRSAFTLGTNANQRSQLEADGTFNLTKLTAQLNFKVAELTQTELRPWLNSFLAPRSLDLVNLSLNGAAAYDPSGASNLRANFGVKNLLVSIPGQSMPRTPLDLSGLIDLSLPTTNLVQIQKLSLDSRTQDKASGSFEVSGAWDLAKSQGQVTYRINDLNQNLLAPWVNPALKPISLVSMQMQADGQARYGTNLEATLNLSLTNCVLQDSGNANAQPLNIRNFRLSGTVRNQAVDIKECTLTLAPTARAQNSIDLRGQLDLNTTNAKSGLIAIKADSLDLTPLYQVWASRPSPKSNAVTVAPAAPLKTEAQPNPLPLSAGEFDLQIGRLYLNQLVISNWTAHARIENRELVVNPFQLVVNGAPVRSSVKLNVSTPDYAYDFSWFTTNLPLDPFVQSFAPTAPAQPNALLFANGQVKGQGFSGAGLRKSLQGTTALGVTNVNYGLIQFVRQKWPPEQNGLVGLSTLLASGSFQGLSSVPGLADVNRATNITSQISLRFADGKIYIQPAQVLTELFVAQSQGSITLADQFTQSSVQLPVDIALRRDLVQKVPALSAVVATNANWAELPSLISIKGTIANCKATVDLQRYLLSEKGLANLPILKDTGVGKFLNSINKTGEQSAVPETGAGTNAPSAPASPASALGNLLPGLLGGSATPAKAQPAPATEAPADETTTTTAPAASTTTSGALPGTTSPRPPAPKPQTERVNTQTVPQNRPAVPAVAPQRAVVSTNRPATNTPASKTAPAQKK
jgi:hypothetical protein